MRSMFILLELIFLIPPLMKLLAELYPKQSISTRRMFLFIILMIPPFIFIDHGHFQPNSMMHGLVLWGVYFIIRGRIELAVIAMVLAINFK